MAAQLEMKQEKITTSITSDNDNSGPQQLTVNPPSPRNGQDDDDDTNPLREGGVPSDTLTPSEEDALKENVSAVPLATSVKAPMDGIGIGLLSENISGSSTSPEDDIAVAIAPTPVLVADGGAVDMMIEKQLVYECPCCEKCFNVRNALAAHMRIHAGEKPYFCRVCGKQFNHIGSLNRHKATEHPRLSTVLTGNGQQSHLLNQSSVTLHSTTGSNVDGSMWPMGSVKSATLLQSQASPMPPSGVDEVDGAAVAPMSFNAIPLLKHSNNPSPAMTTCVGMETATNLSIAHASSATTFLFPISSSASTLSSGQVAGVDAVPMNANTTSITVQQLTEHLQALQQQGNLNTSKALPMSLATLATMPQTTTAGSSQPQQILFQTASGLQQLQIQPQQQPVILQTQAPQTTMPVSSTANLQIAATGPDGQSIILPVNSASGQRLLQVLQSAAAAQSAANNVITQQQQQPMVQTFSLGPNGATLLNVTSNNATTSSTSGSALHQEQPQTQPSSWMCTVCNKVSFNQVDHVQHVLQHVLIQGVDGVLKTTSASSSNNSAPTMTMTSNQGSLLTLAANGSTNIFQQASTGPSVVPSNSEQFTTAFISSANTTNNLQWNNNNNNNNVQTLMQFLQNQQQQQQQSQQQQLTFAALNNLTQCGAPLIQSSGPGLDNMLTSATFLTPTNGVLTPASAAHFNITTTPNHQLALLQQQQQQQQVQQNTNLISVANGIDSNANGSSNLMQNILDLLVKEQKYQQQQQTQSAAAVLSQQQQQLLQAVQGTSLFQTASQVNTTRTGDPLAQKGSPQSSPLRNLSITENGFHGLGGITVPPSSSSSSSGVSSQQLTQQQQKKKRACAEGAVLITPGVRSSSTATSLPPPSVPLVGGKKCPQCVKTFTCLSALRIHYRKHSGERPYICDGCMKSFSQNGTLKRHQVTCKGFTTGNRESGGVVAAAESPSSTCGMKVVVQQSPRALDPNVLLRGSTCSKNVEPTPATVAETSPLVTTHRGNKRKSFQPMRMTKPALVEESHSGVNKEDPSAVAAARIESEDEGVRLSDLSKRLKCDDDVKETTTKETNVDSLSFQEVIAHLVSKNLVYRCDKCKIFFEEASAYTAHMTTMGCGSSSATSGEPQEVCSRS